MARFRLLPGLVAVAWIGLLIGAGPAGDIPSIASTYGIVVGKSLPPPRIVGMSFGGPGDRKVEAALRRIVTVRNRRFTVPTLARALEAVLEIPVRVELASFQLRHVDVEAEFSVDVVEVPVHQLFDALLQHEIGYMIERGRLVLIQSDRCSNSVQHLRVYDVACLPHIPQDRLAEFLQNNTSDPWEDEFFPGGASLERVGDRLLVNAWVWTRSDVETCLNLLASETSPTAP